MPMAFSFWQLAGEGAEVVGVKAPENCQRDAEAGQRRQWLPVTVHGAEDGAFQSAHAALLAAVAPPSQVRPER